MAMSQIRKAENLYFFGSNLPISIKRKYDIDFNVIEIARRKVKASII